MEQKPRKRHGALIFSLVFLAVAGGIAATVLLANEGRHLRVVLRYIGYESRTMVIPKPGTMEAFKGKRLGSAEVLIPGQMFLPRVANLDGAFLRTLSRQDGEGLCVALRAQGFDMTPWEGGAFAKNVPECSYEATVPNPAKPDEPSTFFMIIKGSANGELMSARAKIVITSFGAQAELATRTADALRVFATQTKWLDIASHLPKVATLEPFVIVSHGITARFSKEFSGEGYNLILAASAPLSPAQRRTRDYFDRKRYWPLLPEHGGSRMVPGTEPEEG